MEIYVITGIGTAIRKLLLATGNEDFNIDYKGGDFEADLSTGLSAQK